MSRWWDDKDAAQDVLALVDGSDVAQGVGTAVLAYHAIAKAALTPLVGSTLVDVQAVRDRLTDIDVSSVAKALAVATRTVMGDAADRYGELLADQLHQDAMAGVEQAMKVWTSSGVPMPLAVERAADVVGVPTAHVVKYVNVVKSVAVNPLVRMDAADRALMEFASRVGNRECTGEMVSKDAAFEAAHPRDDDGKFADAASSRNRKSKLRERLAAREAMQRRNVLTRSRLAPPAAPQEAAGQEREQERVQGRSTARSVARSSDRSASSSRSLQSLARSTSRTFIASENANNDDVIGSLLDRPADVVSDEIRQIHADNNTMQVVFLSKQEAMMIAREGGFNTATLERKLGRELKYQTLGSSTLSDALDEAVARFGSADNIVAVTLTGKISIRDGLSDAASNTWDKLAIQDIKTSSESTYLLNGILSGVDAEVQVLPNDEISYEPRIKGKIGVPTKIKGAKVAGRAGVDVQVAAINLRIDEDSVSKAMERWRDGELHNVTRSADGEFASQGGTRRNQLRSRLDRMQRQQRSVQRLRSTVRPGEKETDPPAEGKKERDRTTARSTSRSASRSNSRNVARSRQIAQEIRNRSQSSNKTSEKKKSTSSLEAAELNPSGYTKSKAFFMDLDEFIDAAMVRDYDDSPELEAQRREAMDSTFPEIVSTGAYNYPAYARAMDKFRKKFKNQSDLVSTEEAVWWWQENGTDASFNITEHPKTGEPVGPFARYEDAVSARAELEQYANEPQMGVMTSDIVVVPQGESWSLRRVIYLSSEFPDQIMVFGSARAMKALQTGKPVKFTLETDRQGIQAVQEFYDLESGWFGESPPVVFSAFVEAMDR